MNLPNTIDETEKLLLSGNYVSERSLATSVFLSLSINKPLFLEGEAGVGKTELAYVLSKKLNKKLIRLQCYEGLDISSAAYEWNYPAQMIEIRLSENEKKKDEILQNIYSEKFLTKRPLLKALEEYNGTSFSEGSDINTARSAWHLCGGTTESNSWMFISKCLRKSSGPNELPQCEWMHKI